MYVIIGESILCVCEGYLGDGAEKGDSWKPVKGQIFFSPNKYFQAFRFSTQVKLRQGHIFTLFCDNALRVGHKRSAAKCAKK